MFKFKHSVLSALLLVLASAATVAEERTSATTVLSAAGVSHLQVGRFHVIPLSDGTLPLDLHPILKGAATADIDHLLEHAFQRNPAETSINVYLVDTGRRRILVDTGAGELFGAFGGKLPQSLAAAGYRPEDITDILITHIHTDHSGGLTLDGKIVFPNATVYAGAADVAFFLDPANVGKGLEQQFLEEALKTVEPYRRASRLRTFSEGTQLFPGVTAIPTPGHTPGHAFYRIESEGDSIEFWGDIVHVAAVQLPRPDITITYDVDQNAARAQRQRQFESAAHERQLVAVAHLNFPGIGYLRPSRGGYDWVPVTYRNRE